MQYNSGFVLPPGQYHLKFVVRENQSGRLGSFETDLTVPDLKTAPVKMSSIVLASQLQPNSKTQERQSAGARWFGGNSQVTHVFSAGPAPVFLLRGVRSGSRGGKHGAPIEQSEATRQFVC